MKKIKNLKFRKALLSNPWNSLSEIDLHGILEEYVLEYKAGNDKDAVF